MYLINAWTKNQAKDEASTLKFENWVFYICLLLQGWRQRFIVRKAGSGLKSEASSSRSSTPAETPHGPLYWSVNPQVCHMTHFNPAQHFIIDVQLIPTLAQIPRSSLLDNKITIWQGTWKTKKSQVIKVFKFFRDIDITCEVLFALFAYLAGLTRQDHAKWCGLFMVTALWLVFPSEITTESNSEGNRSPVMEDVYYGRVARHRTWCSQRHGGHRPPYGMCCSSVF